MINVPCPCCERHPGVGTLQLYNPDGSKAERVRCCHCDETGTIKADPPVVRWTRRHKISDEKAGSIREAYERGHRIRQIADLTGVSISTVHRILTGQEHRGA